MVLCWRKEREREKVDIENKAAFDDGDDDGGDKFNDALWTQRERTYTTEAPSPTYLTQLLLRLEREAQLFLACNRKLPSQPPSAFSLSFHNSSSNLNYYWRVRIIYLFIFTLVVLCKTNLVAYKHTHTRVIGSPVSSSSSSSRISRTHHTLHHIGPKGSGLNSANIIICGKLSFSANIPACLYFSEK